jgi:hypothetical protein
MSSTNEDLAEIAEHLEDVDWSEVGGITSVEASVFASRLQRAARRSGGGET